MVSSWLKKKAEALHKLARLQQLSLNYLYNTYLLSNTTFWDNNSFPDTTWII